jgi:dTDP-4-dehydrorhamnose reductase
MRLLVTGARGLLAAAIVREFEAAGWDVVPLDRQALDVTDGAAVSQHIEDARPDLVVNCVGYNNVDGAEADAVSALEVNALAVRHLSEAARRAGAALVHYGTDFVFDGEADRPYVEEDPPNPRSVYAASKLLGEWFALDHPRGYVLRVESLFGEPGPGGSRSGSLSSLVSRLQAGEPVPVFVDRTVSPGYTADIASATRALVERNAPPGIYHCVNAGAASWADIAGEAARLLGLPLKMAPITLESVALPARRPKYSALSIAKLAAAGIVMPPWRDALARHLSEHVKGEGTREKGERG